MGGLESGGETLRWLIAPLANVVAVGSFNSPAILVCGGAVSALAEKGSAKGLPCKCLRMLYIREQRVGGCLVGGGWQDVVSLLRWR